MIDPTKSVSDPSRRGPDLSRRTFIKTASTGAAAAAAAASMGPRAAAASFSSLSTQEQFLLDRITFGRSPAMVAEIQTRGYLGFLRWQLQDPGEDPIDDSRLFEPATTTAPILPAGPAWEDNEAVAHAWKLTPFEIFLDQTYPDPQSPPFTYAPPYGPQMFGHGPHCLLMGAEFGQHQLRWVMTDFLQNVHNTMLAQPHAYLFWLPFLRNVIYANALGKYVDLVKASGKGSSMLYYLGQPNSSKEVPNENYAREVAELHTVGVKSYTVGDSQLNTFAESDIAEFARIFTGWDMHGYGAFLKPATEIPGANWGDFRYTSANHDPDTKTVSMTGGPPGYGSKSYPTLGRAEEAEGDELIEDLVAHPLCALHISRRLIQWFIGDDYERQFQQPWLRTAFAFLSSGGDLKETIRELFNPTYFHQICPSGTRDNKVRRPMNKVMAFKRGLDAYIDYSEPGHPAWLVQSALMGQVSGYWPAPNGYQPENPKWTSTMQPMIQFYWDSVWGGTGFVEPGSDTPVVGNGFRIPASTLDTIFPAGTPVGQYAAKAADHLFGGCLPETEELAIKDILTSTSLGGDKRRWALFYVLTSPAYQFLC